MIHSSSLTLLLPPPSPPQKSLRQSPIKCRQQRRTQHHKSDGSPNGPEKSLPALHNAQITRVHAQITCHEAQRQENDRDDCEDDDGLIVGFGLQRDGLCSKETGGFRLYLELVEVVGALGDGL